MLLEKLSVKPEEIMAIGDGVCDFSMIQLAGLGVAMGNAQDSVKACADIVTTSNDEDGVALAVENNILAEIHPSEIPLDELNARARHALMGNLGFNTRMHPTNELRLPCRLTSERASLWHFARRSNARFS